MGLRAGPRQSRQWPKGRKASRESRVDRLPQMPFSEARSCAVKKAREVLRLPGRKVSIPPEEPFEKRSRWRLVRCLSRGGGKKARGKKD